jgi:hypothetical protein
MHKNIMIKFPLGHLKKNFWFSDNGFQKKGKVGRVFIFCFYFQSNMGRVKKSPPHRIFKEEKNSNLPPKLSFQACW